MTREEILNEYLWVELRKSVQVLIDSSQLNKLEGDKWLIYKVGNIIRIDLK